MLCSKCGIHLEKNDSFCYKCGATIESLKSENLSLNERRISISKQSEIIKKNHNISMKWWERSVKWFLFVFAGLISEFGSYILLKVFEQYSANLSKGVEGIDDLMGLDLLMAFWFTIYGGLIVFAAFRLRSFYSSAPAFYLTIRATNLLVILGYYALVMKLYSVNIPYLWNLLKGSLHILFNNPSDNDFIRSSFVWIIFFFVIFEIIFHISTIILEFFYYKKRKFLFVN